MRTRNADPDTVEPLLGHDPGALGPYALLGRLGEGGMGIVYLGRAADGDLVAVKTLRPALTAGCGPDPPGAGPQRPASSGCPLPAARQRGRELWVLLLL